MKFEKLNENKIRITLSNQDLIEKNIDFDSFLSNSDEAQDLFLNMLEEAEQKVGFITKDYKIKIEALALADGDFIINITRFGKKEDSDTTTNLRPRKVLARRKSATINSENLVYSFENFDDFCIFSSYVSKNKNFNNISKSAILYTYKGKYYLHFSKLNIEHPNIKKFYTLITEFGCYVHNSDLFICKLRERGTIVIKNNALKICQKHFN